MTTTDRAAPKRRRQYAARVPLEERRTQLLDAARAVIQRDGFGAVTVAAVAEQAGVTKPVVYSAFTSLDELLEVLFDREQARAVGQLVEVLPRAMAMADVDELVESIAYAWIGAIQADPTLWSMFLSVGPGTPSAVWQRIEGGREVLRTALAALIQPRLSARARAEGVSPALVAGLVLAAAELCAKWIIEGSPHAVPAEVVATIRGLTRGIVN